MSILTTCAACAKPIDHEAPAHCVNCQTRYCSDRCLRYHAHRGGHDDKCDDIANGGGAEQNHANKKYEEAVADAVEECADDTEGQTCYICLEGGADEGVEHMSREFDIEPITRFLALHGLPFDVAQAARCRSTMTSLAKRMARASMYRAHIQHDTELARGRVRALEKELALERAKAQKQHARRPSDSDWQD